MIKNLILSGGVAHEYEKTSPVLMDVLKEANIESEIYESFDIVEGGGIHDFDILTLNCVRWTCSQVPKWHDKCFKLSEKTREHFLKFFKDGKGMLALHCATICFDDWPEFYKILGARWEWEHSGHSPLQDNKMIIKSKENPITKGLSDFTIFDELYTYPKIYDSINPLIEAVWEDVAQPILWTRNYGRGRICYNALGHGVEAFENSTNRELLKRGALWVGNSL
jgi:type 1 glutamine amidotransferase